MNLTDRELATILHALRVLQCGGRFEGCAAGICQHFVDAEALNDQEIDELCERMNLAAPATTSRETNGEIPGSDAAQQENLLERVTVLQVEFWEALSELENALGGLELDASMEFAGHTIDDLLGESSEDEEARG